MRQIKSQGAYMPQIPECEHSADCKVWEKTKGFVNTKERRHLRGSKRKHKKAK